MSDSRIKAGEAQLGIAPGGWTREMDLSLLSVTEQEVVAELVVSPKHHQPMGIVHGGVYCSIVETVCSVGAFVHSSKHGQYVVGVDNQTSFLKATRSGTLRAVARPVAVSRRTQLWEAEIRDQKGILVATGRVRLLSLEPEVKLDGTAAGSEPPKAGSTPPKK